MPNGKAKIIPSTLSRSPPCPGSKLPVSLTFALRFKNEINRSPKIDNKTIPKPTKILLKLKEFEKFKLKKTNQSVPKINAEINPDKVLLGDTELNNLGPPKIFPKIYAPISLINIVDNIIININNP